jgi:hypothetical protein
MTTELEPAIHRLLVDPDFLELEKSGRDSNLFETLAVSHMEMWHSAFIKWILDPTLYFGLGDFPLKRFLFLVLQAGKQSQKYTLSLGDLEELDLSEMPFSTEFTDKALLGAEGGRARIDILGGQQRPDNNVPTKTNEAKVASMRIIVENKILAQESADQTLRYYEWAKKSSGDYDHEFLIFITPDPSQNPKSEQFVKITYQQLCDDVIKPCLTHPELPPESCYLLKQYLGNLKKAYKGRKVMAYPNKEICLKIYEAHKDVLDEIITAVKGEAPVASASAIKVQRLGVAIGDLVESGVLQLNDTLHAHYQDTDYVATLKAGTDENVVIALSGKDFSTPTGAAKNIMKREVNGWVFWNAKNAQGEDKGLLADLREKHIELQNKASAVE